MNILGRELFIDILTLDGHRTNAGNSVLPGHTMPLGEWFGFLEAVLDFRADWYEEQNLGLMSAVSPGVILEQEGNYLPENM